MSPRQAPLLAVDGGASKVDAALLGRDGSIIAAARVPNYNRDGLQRAEYLTAVAEAVARLADEVGADAERQPVARLGVYCLAGADLPQDDRRIMRWLSSKPWTEEDVLRNDTFAVLRAGTDRTWGVGIVCGSGTNCSGVAPNGREYRLPAVGQISGDWGGAFDIGSSALWHAIRSEDGRGGPTSLAKVVPQHFGMRRPRQVMEAIYFGRLQNGRVAELPPLVFAEAERGDSVARSIVDRQADEIATMANAAIRKLRMQDVDVDVVLGGGIFRNRFSAFFERIEAGVEAVAPRARLVVLQAPPVVGAAMLGLDVVGAPASAHRAVRIRLTEERLTETLDRTGKERAWQGSSSSA